MAEYLGFEESYSPKQMLDESEIWIITALMIHRNKFVRVFPTSFYKLGLLTTFSEEQVRFNFCAAFRLIFTFLYKPFLDGDDFFPLPRLPLPPTSREPSCSKRIDCRLELFRILRSRRFLIFI